MLWAVKRQVDNNNDVRDQKGEENNFKCEIEKANGKVVAIRKNGKKCQFVHQIIDPET